MRRTYARSLDDTFDIAYQVMTSERFIEMEGLGNEVPYFVLRYRPEWEPGVDKAVRRLTSRVRQHYPLTVVDVFGLAHRLWRESGYLETIIEAEGSMPEQDFRDGLTGLIDPETRLAPAIDREIARDADARAVLVTGVHHLFPLVRAHRLLNCLQPLVSRRPLVLAFPGSYNQSPERASSLVLFDRVGEDNYYRAFDLLDQRYALDGAGGATERTGE